MNMQLYILGAIAIFMMGLLIEIVVFRIVHNDQPTTYKLYSVRDELIRLVAEDKILRNDPTFDAIYENVNSLLIASHYISGPSGWAFANWIGKTLARNPHLATKLREVDTKNLSPELIPVVSKLTSALRYLVKNHTGILTQINSQRKEIACIQKEQAQELLAMMPNGNIQTNSKGCIA